MAYRLSGASAIRRTWPSLGHEADAPWQGHAYSTRTGLARGMSSGMRRSRDTK
jgi:hypothetical protein